MTKKNIYTYSRIPAGIAFKFDWHIQALVSCLETETLNQKLVKRSKREKNKNDDLVQWFRA